MDQLGGEGKVVASGLLWVSENESGVRSRGKERSARGLSGEGCAGHSLEHSAS